MKQRYNLDFLKVCFKPSEALFNYLLKEMEINPYIERDGYSILIINSHEEGKNYVHAILTDLGDGEKMGELIVNAPDYKNGYIFMKMENKALYSPISYRCNKIPYIQYIADDLGLEYNNITQLDIALDTNANAIRRFQKYQRDTETYNMIVNNRKVDEVFSIPNLIEINQANRWGKILNTSINLHNHDRSLKLRIYGKGAEIKESGKNYIYLWNDDFNEDRLIYEDKLYRSEISVRNEDIKQYTTLRRIDTNFLFYHLTQDDFLADMFDYFTSRVIRFTKKKGRKSILLSDVLQ